MKRINGSGTLVAFDGDDIESESHDGGVAEIRIPFPADRVAEMDYYNAAGRLLRMEKITWLPNGTASVALTDAGGGAQALSINKSGLGFGADDGRRSQISQYGLTFDSEGRLVKRLYLSVWGMPIKDFFGKLRTDLFLYPDRPDRVVSRTRRQGRHADRQDRHRRHQPQL